jgi:trans-aconitate methyltransferase
MFITKRFKKLEANVDMLLKQSGEMMIIMHNLIEDMRNSGESRKNDLVFANVLYKALDGHYKAISKLIDKENYLKNADVKRIYGNRFLIHKR